MTETTFQCGLEAVLAILGGKWKPLIVFNRAGGSTATVNYACIATNVSEKMLIQHLKELTDDGVIRRIDFQKVPPHVEYELTDFGRSLTCLLAPLCEWGTRHSDKLAAIVKKREQPAKVA